MDLKKKKTLVHGKKSVARSIGTSVKIPKNKNIQGEIENNEELLRITFDSSFDFIQVFKAVRDKHGKITDFKWILNNRNLIEKQGDRVGKSLIQLNPGVIETGLFDNFVQVTETGISQTSEFYYDHEGFNDWFHQTIIKLNDGFILTGEIITERKNAEQELLHLKDELAQKAVDKYLAIFNSINEGFHLTEVIFDENKKAVDIAILEENPAARKILGGSFIGKTIKDLKPDYEELRLNIWSEVVESGESRRITLYSDIWKKWFDFHLTKVSDESNNKVALIFQDITDRKSAEEVLRKSEARLAMDLAETKLLQSFSSQLIQEDNIEAIYDQLLNAATGIMHSEMGSIQLLIPEKNELFLLGWKGFDEQIAKHWEWIKIGANTICNVTLKKNKRIIVPDIEDCDFLKRSEYLEAYRSAGIRAGQSTPLITRAGHIVGIISTLWHTVHEPTEQELNLLDVLARQAADLIERKQREEKYLSRLHQEVHERTIELKESKELLQNIADAIPDMVSVQEYPSRKVIYFNREPYTLSGLNADELSKKTVEERQKFVHPEDIASLQKYADSFAALSNDDIATTEYRVLNKLNEWIWLSVRGKVFERDEKGNVISLVAVVQNINAQKKGEEEIAKQHNILKQAEELAKIGSWEYNIKTKEFLWSDGMYALFNMNKGNQVKPAIFIDHVTEKERAIAEKIVTDIESSFQPFEETMYLKIDGDIKAIKIKATPLKNNKEEVEKMLGVNIDITASLESAQKIMGLNDSLLTMNKELNFLNSELRSFNNITANNYGEALRQVYINLETIITSDARHLSDSGRANIRRAQSAVQKMKLLTNDIHNYLELYDTGIKKELISPKINLQGIIERIKEKIEETNTKIVIEELSAFSADPVLFSKLLTNLIDNSIKFRKHGEDPVVNIKHTKINDLKNVPVPLTGMPYTIVTVTDNGIGFETTEKIFELFSQLPGDVKHKGSGMGLAICKKIMDMHGGYITAEAEPGKGASFHCFFPE